MVYTDIAICLVIPFFGIFLMTLFSYSYVIKAMMLSLIVLTIIFIIEVHDSCEVYVLPKYGGYSPIYYICPESGYFVLYW